MGIQMGSNVGVMDNTTAIEARCLRIVGAGKKKYGQIGDKLIIVVTKVLLTQQILIPKGKLMRGLLVRTKGWCRRKLQHTRLRFKENSIVLVNKKWSPIGRRLEGPMPQEIGWVYVYVGSVNNGVV